MNFCRLTSSATWDYWLAFFYSKSRAETPYVFVCIVQVYSVEVFTKQKQLPQVNVLYLSADLLDVYDKYDYDD